MRIDSFEVMDVKQNYRSIGLAAASLLGIMALILDAKTAASAAAGGITLCLETVIPALFPFLVLGRLFSASAAARWCTRLLGPWMEPVFGLPPQGAPALALGMVSGYPVGAQIAADLYQSGRISREDGERLLAFCSNAGPAFIFGMVGGLLGNMKTAAALYAIHLLAAMLTGIVLKPRRGARSACRIVCGPPQETVDLPGAVRHALRSMAMICGYIILFRILSIFLGNAWQLWMPPAAEVIITGLLELAGGCCRLPALESAGLRYLLASGFLAFGGICVYLQTLAVINPAGLSGRYYLFGKVIQGAIAVLLTWGGMVIFPQLFPREASAAAVPNHQGLPEATGLITALTLAGLAIWCIYLGKKAGKPGPLDV